MTDTSTVATVAVTAPAVVAVNKETFLQHIEAFFENIGSTVESDAEAAADRIAALVKQFDTAALPAFEQFVATLATQVGQAALKAAIASVPLLATGGFSAAAASVGAAVVATAATNAPVDAQQALQAVQGALTVAKVSTNTVIPSDAPTQTAIADAAATPAAQ